MTLTCCCRGIDGIHRELSTSWMRRGRGVNLHRRPRIRYRRSSTVDGRDVVASVHAVEKFDRGTMVVHERAGTIKEACGRRREETTRLAPLNHILHTRCISLNISQHTVTLLVTLVGKIGNIGLSRMAGVGDEDDD
ncbi:hypothetical protein SCHPADRAFT_897585, partial [Schizopora paradoxa]